MSSVRTEVSSNSGISTCEISGPVTVNQTQSDGTKPVRRRMKVAMQPTLSTLVSQTTNMDRTRTRGTNSASSTDRADDERQPPQKAEFSAPNPVKNRVSESSGVSSPESMQPSPTGARPGFKWTKSSSSSIWKERGLPAMSFDLPRSPKELSRDHKSSDSSGQTKSSFPWHRNASQTSPVKPLSPLRPPNVRVISTPAITTQTVSIVTEFTEAKKDESEREGTASRRSSFNLKALLGASVQRAKHLYEKSASLLGFPFKPDPGTSQSSTGGLNNLKTGNRTAVKLARVTSMLQELNHVQPVHRPTVLGDESTASAIVGFDLPARRTRRLTGNLSVTSSMYEARIGVVPTVTPDPNQTYRIKRSSSARTEEYPIIDISIHGGTSYLPSEAARVHTPPLPGQRAGRTRGLFFDYNDPEGDAGDTFYQSPLNSPKLTRDEEKCWMASALAEVDAMPDKSRKPSSSKSVPIPPPLDFNIAEHYAGSPLCPRSDRYWRKVENKLYSEGEACWQHG